MAECDREVEFATDLAEVKARCKSNTHRLDKLESITEAVHELAVAMTQMVEKQNQTAETVERLDAKLTEIESKPGKRWDQLVEKVILTIVAAVVGFTLASLGIH